MIDKIFQAALEDIIYNKKLFRQSEIAKRVGLSPGFLNDLVKGRRKGTEEHRRMICAALGMNYDHFLERGREILGLKMPADLLFTDNEIDTLIMSHLKDLDIEDKKTLLRFTVRCTNSPTRTSEIIKDLLPLQPELGPR